MVNNATGGLPRVSGGAARRRGSEAATRSGRENHMVVKLIHNAPVMLDQYVWQCLIMVMLDDG